ncbi:MAG: GH3 auxin-responsive promoter family protein, partial [Dehalococcoidia bacterium]|nr:GH3 auxin-responsive promoter family protein [Dehalococcoidia bacterium]
MINKEELFKTGNQERIWQKYCGFLDLSLDEFMEIQEQLLMEQIELVYDSPLGKKFMATKPKDASEFRRLVPLTTFNDYAAYLNNKNEDVLAVKPYRWVVTSGRGGSPKWVPYTERALEKFGMYGIAVMILACTTRKGEVNIRNGMRVLLNLPAAPYMTGTMMQFLAPRMGASLIPPPDKYENADFETKLQAGFKIALYSGVDVLSSLTSVLVKMGERFTESSGQLKLSRQMLHLRLLRRLLLAWLRCKKEGRPM